MNFELAIIELQSAGQADRVGMKAALMAALRPLASVRFPPGLRQRWAIDLLNDSQSVGNQRGAATAYSDLGRANIELDQSENVIGYFAEAARIFSQLGDASAEADELCNLSWASNELGRPQDAREYSERALLIYRQLGNTRGEATALGHLGSAYYALEQQADAVSILEQAIRKSDEARAAEWYGQLSLAYEELGDLENAVRCMRQLVQFRVRIAHPKTEAANAKLHELLSKRQAVPVGT